MPAYKSHSRIEWMWLNARQSLLVNQMALCVLPIVRVKQENIAAADTLVTRIHFRWVRSSYPKIRQISLTRRTLNIANTYIIYNKPHPPSPPSSISGTTVNFSVRCGAPGRRLRTVASAGMLLLSALSLGLVESSQNDRQRISDIMLFSGANDNETFRADGPGDWSIEQCFSLRGHNPNLYFQLGNAFFFLAFLATHGAWGQMWLRSMLIIGCVLMVMWGWLVECSSDAVLWSGLFLAVNLVYFVVLVCRLRPVRFEKEIEAVSCWFK